MNHPITDVGMQFGHFDDEGPIWVTDFDDESAVGFCNSLFRACKKNPYEPIIVYINSPGGDISSLMTMLSAIDSVPNDIITVAMGNAMSCGAALLSHGTQRFASPHARIMIHKMSAGTIGHIEDIENDSVELVRLNKYFMDLLRQNLGKTEAQMDKMFNKRRDIFLTPEEARKEGVIDMVGVPFVEAVPSRPKYNIGVATTKAAIANMEDLENVYKNLDEKTLDKLEKIAKSALKTLPKVRKPKK